MTGSNRGAGRLPRLLAATAIILPAFAGTLATEDSFALISGSFKTDRLVTGSTLPILPSRQEREKDAALALNQALPLQLLPDAALDGSVETASNDPAVPGTLPEKPKATPDDVELAALYYYAEQKQEARVNAEADRLRLKYPDFQLPKDLFVDHSKKLVDEASLWALFEKNDFAGIDQEITRLAAANPGWQPSEDFAGKLAHRKLRVTLTKAYAGKDWVGMIAAGTGINPRTETEADLLWMMIDAYREAAMPDALGEIYKGILFRPKEERLPDPILVTTLQKATQDFPATEIRSAMATLWPNPSQVAALKPLNDDFIRSDIADFNNRSERQEPIADKDIQRIRDLVAARNAPGDMSLLGWYFLKLKQPQEAEPYFSKGLALKATPEFTKGLYLSLAQQKRDEEAYALAAAHLTELVNDPQFLMNALSLRFAKPELGPIDPKTVAAYSGTILQTKSADNAEILAWYAYNTRQFQASEAWFVQAWNWEEQPTRLKGIALSFLREGKKKQFAALRQRFGDLYPDMWAEITSAKAPQRQMGAVAAIASPAMAQQVIYAAPQAQATAPAYAPVAEAQPVVYQVATAPVQAEPAQQQTQIVYASAPIEDTTEEAAPAKPVQRSATIGKSGRGGYVAALQAKNYSACISELNGIAAAGSLGADAELIRGWCYLGLNRVAEARTSFAKALTGTGQTRRDASYGFALAALRVKLTDDAEAVITAYPLDAKKDREVRAEIYWQRARSAFDHKDYQGTLDALNARLNLVPESSDLSTLRAWAHAKLGHTGEARQIFTKLNSQLSDPDLMQGMAALEKAPR